MKQHLWRFFGGLKLNGKKHISMTQVVHPAAIPPRLVIPLHQHIGSEAEPVVNPGDKVLKGQLIAKASDYVSASIHASSSGTVVAIEQRAIPHPSGLYGTCIVIDTDGEDHWCELQAVNHYTQLDPSALRNVIRDAGIVGLGGAGFPSYIKLNPGPKKYVDTLILNGAECEPYISCDAMLMQYQPRRILDGLLIMKHALRAQRCIIAVEDNKKVAHTQLVNALHEHESDFISIVQIPTIYPTGGEKQLIKVLTGKEVPAQSLPLNLGIVCHNVATAVAVADAIDFGQPLISRVVTVSGEALAEPQNLDVLIGTPFQQLLSHCGWQAEKPGPVIMGGPMMGFEVPALDIPVIKTTNCVLALKPAPQQAQAAMPCIRCGRCAQVCPVQLLPQQLYWHARAKDFDRAQDYHLFDCIECGCCAHVCPSHIPLVQYYRFAKTGIWSQEREKRKADIARERHEYRAFRLERKKQEDEERKQHKKAMLKKTQGQKSAGNGEQQADINKATIEAAMARVKARREQQAGEQRNVDNLTAQQREAIETIEDRRRRLLDAESGSVSPEEDAG